MFDTSLTLLNGIDNQVVERTTSGRDGYVVLVIDDTKISQTTLIPSDLFSYLTSLNSRGTP